jgi:hypothetical protein
MPQEKARRQLKLETDLYLLFQQNPIADQATRWRHPRSGKHILWCRKALDIFHKYQKLSKQQDQNESYEHGTPHFAEKHQREPELRRDGSQSE